MTQRYEGWRSGSEDEEAPKPEISATWLRECSATAARPHARAQFVNWLVALVDRTWRRLRGGGDDAEVTGGQQAVRDASQMVAQAAAGKLESASLDGDLKKAQIAQMYAQASRDNAQANVLNEEAAAKRIDNALRLAEALGVRVSVERLPDGSFTIVLAGAVIQHITGEATPGAETSDDRRGS